MPESRMPAPGRPGSTEVYRRRMPEHRVPGKPLGRHVEHDPRSWDYRHQRTAPEIKTVLWARKIAVLDQGDTSACTGNAETGALGTEPLYGTLAAAGVTVTLNEAEALRLYSAAEVIDGDGPYPPNDNGSSGLSVCKAAKNAGLISGYTHLMSAGDVKDALQTGPVILGTSWYTSFDTPDTDGLVVIAAGATVRGGHEYEAIGYNTEADLFTLVNSWGTSYGDQGRFHYSTATLTRLLAEEGDGTVSIPLTEPAPTPQPTPAAQLPRRHPGRCCPAVARAQAPGHQRHDGRCPPDVARSHRKRPGGVMTIRSFPVLASTLLSTALALAVGLGAPWNSRTTGIIEACVAFGVGLVLAIVTQPRAVAPFVGTVNALIIALAAYKIPHVTPGLVSVVDSVVVALAAFFVHTNVSPVAADVARPVAQVPRA